MSLGRNPASVDADLVVARRAMESGVCFPSSPTYNNGFTFIGGTASLEHLEMYLAAADGTVPLPADILEQTRELQQMRDLPPPA